MAQVMLPFPIQPVVVSAAARATTKKRKRVNRACVSCQKSHMSCDQQRPCRRCVERGMGHLCKDGVRKQRGRKRKGRQGVPNASELVPIDAPFAEDDFYDNDDEEEEEVEEHFDLALLEPEAASIPQIPKRPVGRPRKIRKDREIATHEVATHIHNDAHCRHIHGECSSPTSSPQEPDWEASNSPTDSGADNEESSVDIESTSLEWDSEDGSHNSAISSAPLPEIIDILRSSDPFALYNSLEDAYTNQSSSEPLCYSFDSDDWVGNRQQQASQYTLLDCFL